MRPAYAALLSLCLFAVPTLSRAQSSSSGAGAGKVIFGYSIQDATFNGSPVTGEVYLSSGSGTDDLLWSGDNFDFTSDPVKSTQMNKFPANAIVLFDAAGDSIDLVPSPKKSKGQPDSDQIFVSGSLNLNDANEDSYDLNDGAYLIPAATPEPSSLILLGTGALGALAAARRRFSRT